VELKAPQDFLTLDPIAMNVVNRVAAGTHLDGQLHFEGGLLVQGELSGQIQVNGRLIVWTDGEVRGRIRVAGDLYLFGRLGAADADALDTTVECTGMVCVAQTGVSTATLIARRLQLYEGAHMRGPFKTLKQGSELPVLSDAFAETP